MSTSVIVWTQKNPFKFPSDYDPFKNDFSKYLHMTREPDGLAYSHLSNKREVTLTDFEKFHPPQKKSTLHVY